MILNGYYILPLGYSWAVLLGNFIREVNRYDGQPMDERDMEKVVATAVKKTRKTFRVQEGRLFGDLQEMLTMLYGVARGKEPDGEIEPLSLREYAPHMTAPHRMDLMVSAMTKEEGAWNCNLRCRHCYAAGQQKAEERELSTEQWKAIIDKLRAAGVPQITFTGGEPTLRQDLVELTEYARWFVTRLNTNGILLSPELSRELYEASLDSVQITLYSWNHEIHDTLVGTKHGFWQTVQGIRNALEAGLNVSVNTPLCRDNRDYDRTLAFLNELGVRYVTCSGLIETGKASLDGSVSSQLSAMEMGEILERASGFCRENGKGETASFWVTVHQQNMLCESIYDPEKPFYDFTPGWFNQINVLRYEFTWEQRRNIISHNADRIEDGNLVWEGSLKKGESRQMTMTCALEGFRHPKLVEWKPYQNSVKGDSPVSGSIVLVILTVTFCAAFNAGGGFDQNSYEGGRGYHRYHGIHRGGGSGGSCACAGCACACACAGGGRAGCSKKDFYHNTPKNF